MKKDLNWLINNIIDDINRANNSELDDIYVLLNQLLKKYDNDLFFKNISDFFKKAFKSKREKCKLIFNDIVENIDMMSENQKSELKKDLKDLSNIHRTFLEDLIALIEAL